MRHTARDRYSVMYGGRRSGKTFSRLQWLYLLCAVNPNQKNQVIAETLPIIKSGCLADFKMMFGGTLRENTTDKIFFFPNGSTLQFLQVDSPAKAIQIGRATNRFINEANNIDKETFDNLAISTEHSIFLDFNPTAKFWIDEITTETNTAKFNWYDNEFLTTAQKEQFKLWTEIGKASKEGSPNYYRWQVFCEGNWCELAGDIISLDNLHFEKTAPQLVRFVAFADPSNARGNDYFATCLCGMDINGDVWLVDSLSFNNAPKVLIFEKLKEWRERYRCEVFIEINGDIGKKFFNDCIVAGLSARSWWSSANKFDRIFANLDIFFNRLRVLDTPANLEFCGQFYQFSPDNKEGHDDNIDALNNVFLYYIEQNYLKNLFA